MCRVLVFIGVLFGVACSASAGLLFDALAPMKAEALSLISVALEKTGIILFMGFDIAGIFWSVKKIREALRDDDSHFGDGMPSPSMYLSEDEFVDYAMSDSEHVQDAFELGTDDGDHRQYMSGDWEDGE